MWLTNPVSATRKHPDLSHTLRMLFSNMVLNIKHFSYNFAADLTRLYKSVVCSYDTTNLFKSISNPFFL